MNGIEENVRRNLARYLGERGISQGELAMRLGISPTSVDNWIRGASSPDIEAVAQICDCLEITVNDLFGGDAITDCAPLK